MTDITLAGIALPEDLSWLDEFAPWRIGNVQRTTLTGALVIQASARLSGRPITLATSQHSGGYVGAVTFATLNALRALEDQLGTTPMTLVIPGYNEGPSRTFAVQFNRAAGAAIEAEPLVFKVPYADDDYFQITLRLIEV